MHPENVLKKLTDKELKSAASEVIDWHKTGILKGDRLRNIANEYKSLNIPSDICLTLAEKEVLFESTIRFINS